MKPVFPNDLHHALWLDAVRNTPSFCSHTFSPFHTPCPRLLYLLLHLRRNADTHPCVSVYSQISESELVLSVGLLDHSTQCVHEHLGCRFVLRNRPSSVVRIFFLFVKNCTGRLARCKSTRRCHVRDLLRPAAMRPRARAASLHLACIVGFAPDTSGLDGHRSTSGRHLNLSFGRLIDQVIHRPFMRTRSCGQGLLKGLLVT